MAVLTDAEFSTLIDSYGFFIQPNWVDQKDSGPSVRRSTIDEFVRIVPRETYDRNPINGIKGSRPLSTGATPGYLPLAVASDVVGWFASGGTLHAFDVGIPSSVNSTYETFFLKRLGAFVELDPYQQKLLATRGATSSGPDPVSTIRNAVKVASVRALGRALVNGDRTNTDMLHGLAGLYDDQFISPGADPQVFQSGVALTLTEVRKLCRLVVPSGDDGLGEGPNALVMSRRTRDVLIATEQNTTVGARSVQFLPDPMGTGGLRYHFNGIPVYVAPCREDEVTTSSPTHPVFGADNENASSIYALRLGGRTGVRLIHFGGSREDFGLQFEDIAPSASSGPTGYRVHGSYALVVPERTAVARLWGIDISSEPY